MKAVDLAVFHVVVEKSIALNDQQSKREISGFTHRQILRASGFGMRAR
jgi:hypothetical protein